MSQSDSAANLQRIVLIDVFDAQARPLDGATVKLIVAGKVRGEVTTSSGRATFQISRSDLSVSVEASYGEWLDRADLGTQTVHWKFHSTVDTAAHLVILVHGINTRAPWISDLKEVLRQAGMQAEGASYGVYGLIRFLLPFEFLRKKSVERVRIRVNAARELHKNKHEKLSVIAHSFGTYVVARLMEKEFGIKWHRIIFCGSVVPATFPFEQYLPRFDGPIINEIGTKDFLPALAEAVTWGYGSVGSHGFNGAPLEDRWHKDSAHSDFLTAKFCNEFWIPFLKNGEVVKAASHSPLAWWIRWTTRLPLRWICVPILLLLWVAGPVFKVAAGVGVVGAIVAGILWAFGVQIRF